jgi:hypothetical protein
MSTDLSPIIIKELKEVATVNVVVTDNMNTDTSVITIDSGKLREIMCGYDYLRTLVNRTWSNLPTPPVKEKTHVFVWLIASRDYCINHSTIKWPGASPNTFVHLWSIMDRIKSSLMGVDSSWLIGSRDCVQYCSTTGMNMPMDTYMYMKEGIVPDQIAMMERRPEIFRHDPTSREFDSFYDFQMSTYTPKPLPVVNVSHIGLSNITKASLGGPPS